MANLAGVRVLVVDDYEDSADVLALLFNQHGAHARAAYDAANIVSDVADFDANLVVLDVGLDRVDGFAACRQLREANGGAVHVVGLTGWVQEGDIRRARQAGFDLHLEKPVQFDRLLKFASSLAASPF